MSGRVVYAAALAGGVAYVLWLLPWAAMVPADPLHEPAWGDVAASVIGQRYLLGGPWVWPPVVAAGLAGGTNVALTDSIPLAVLLLKPLRGLLLPGASVSTCWAALMLAVQPAAAVYALRGVGERRVAPAVAVAVLASAMPTLLARFGHQALCSHAAILLALGLYARLVAGRRLWMWAGLLLAGCVLVHPYIAALVAAVLVAVPVTVALGGGGREGRVREEARTPLPGLLPQGERETDARTFRPGPLSRGERGWWGRSMRGLGGCLAAAGGVAWGMGFGGSRPAAGFGFYSMNLLGPVLPGRSSLLPALGVDATGGQAGEGYQYLGAGVLLLCAVAAVLAAGSVVGRARLRRHAGLVLVLAGCGVFALSNRAFAGRWLLYDAGPVPAVLEQFRATSRFFWPVAYALVVGGVAVVARRLRPGAAAAVLVAAVALQVADTRQLRADVSGYRFEWALDVGRLRPVFARHRALTQWPSFGCGADGASAVDTQIVLLASETLMATNTAVTARERGVVDCDPVPVIGTALRAGELRVLTHAGDAWLVPGECRRAGALALCSADAASLAGLQPVVAARLVAGERVGPGGLLPLLGRGWSHLEADGVWSDGGEAALELERPAGAAVLRLELLALAPEAGGGQVLTAGEGVRAVLPDGVPVVVAVPVPADGPGVAVLRLRIGAPTRPVDRGLPGDVRALGVKLVGVTLVTP